mgnify:CR=1 FL=1|jgi:Sporulation inhibitor A.
MEMSTELLIEAYKAAVKLEFDQQFIETLKYELARRDIQANTLLEME